MVKTGLDRLSESHFAPLSGENLAVICNQASIDRNSHHLLQLLQAEPALWENVKSILGPQHGLFGHTQDNMIEWEGDQATSTGPRVHSLYGIHRKPTPEMLKGATTVLFDLQEVGARYYTFLWTLLYAIEACAEQGLRLMILDRPNPIGGLTIEGPMGTSEFKSFVGLEPLPIRYGMTIGEIAHYLNQQLGLNCALEVIGMSGWNRDHYFDQTGLPWGMPSPNMPTLDTAIVYPGQCLIEGTELSEGRGTTRPFEIFGAPYFNADHLTGWLNDQGHLGCNFQPFHFEPTFQKFAGEYCQGAFLRVNNRQEFRSVPVTLSILEYALTFHRDAFRWKAPPYEYEYEKLPIDILLGSDRWRLALESGAKWTDLWPEMKSTCDDFLFPRSEALLYSAELL